MGKLYWLTNRISKEDKKKVYSFIKPYETNDLTIIFSDNWKQRLLRGNKYVKLAPNSPSGVYFRKGNTFLYGIGGKNNISVPCIAVNTIHDTWYKTFLHEFGHYIDDKTNGGIQKYKRHEPFAKTFAYLMEHEEV